ncbi:MAG TPA: site-specific DNA-methyltransferase [Acidobacteriota bacterium]
MLKPHKKREYRPRPNARKSSKDQVADFGDGRNVVVPNRLDFNQILTGDATSLLKHLPDRCIDLVILDPPYWKVVGETWDFRWRTEDDYRKWCAAWFREIERVCKRSASLYLFGYVRNLVHLFHDVCDLGFEFRQEIIVDKGIKSIAGRKTSTYKQFPNTTETVFFFIYDAKPAIRELLKERQKELGLDAKEINEKLGVESNGGGVWSLYSGENILAQVPTKEMWNRLEQVLDFKAPDDLKGFVFNPQMGLTNVWQDIDFYAEKRIHRTQKPLPLIERLILASSVPGQTVLDPFAGSGTTLIACNNLNRNCIAIEVDRDIAEKAARRVEMNRRQTSLFEM